MTALIGAALLPGVAGLTVMNRTADTEKARFAKQAEVQREIDYFKANIGKVTSAADLVKDRRLLAVALDAFGLGTDINAQGRVRKVLEEGVLQPKALANKLIDPRYKEMAGAFQFDLMDGDKLQDPAFIQDLIDRYTTTKFEGAVGDTNPDLRNAMYFQRKISSVNNWYEVLGDKGLFAVVKTAVGLPDSFSKIDVDQQVKILESKVKLESLQDPKQIQKLATKFIAISAAQASQATTMSPAMQILSARDSSFGLSSDTLYSLLSVQGLSR